jgi:hypothetical protein
MENGTFNRQEAIYSQRLFFLQAYTTRRDISMIEEVKKLLDKAEHALEVAEQFKKAGYPSDSASKIGT